MFSRRALSELEARRQRLLAAAESHRVALRTELTTLAEALGWADRAALWLHRARPLLWIAAPAAGYLVARRTRTILRWLPRLLPWWRVARGLGKRLRRGHQAGTG